MSDLISREAIRQATTEKNSIWNKITDADGRGLDEILDFIPSVELIRCKYCKWYDGYYCHNPWWGDGHGNYTPPIKQEEGFCDWAERKES